MSKSNSKTSLKFLSESSSNRFQAQHPKSKSASWRYKKKMISTEEEEEETLESQSSMKSPPPENRFAALKIDDDDDVDNVKDLVEVPASRVGRVPHGDHLRPYDFDFPFEYVTESPLKREKKVRRMEFNKCQVCHKERDTNCRHYQYNRRWNSYVLISCIICNTKGQHWPNDCPHRHNFKPDLSQLEDLEEVPTIRYY